MNKKKTIIIFGIILLSLIIVLFFALSKSKEELTQEEKLKERIEELGKDFYENFYYQQVGSTDDERKKFLEKYSNIGIKINLDSLSRFNIDKKDEILKEFINDDKQESCDINLSKIVIYPTSPYDKTNYRIVSILECGFETANNE